MSPTIPLNNPAGGPPPDASPAPAPLTVPLKFLAQPDDSEAMQTPGKGDTGTMTVDYTVQDIQGESAIVVPVSINGNELGEDDDSGETPDPDEQEGAALQGMAQQMDQQQ